MLEKKTEKQILDFVRVKPRTVQEVAALIGKNWRTAERYTERIATETGMISARTFREGTRGALKVVFWNSFEGARGSAVQDRLLRKIENGKRKEDFSPLDIYQFVPDDKREAYIEQTEFPRHPLINYDKLLLTAERQVLFFSGNLSWMEFGPERLKTLERIAKKHISIKILTRVDVTSLKNTELALAINHRIGWDAVQIRHCEQPLRVAVVDDTLATIKEVIPPIRELKQKTYLFYVLRDQEWVVWLQKVFWHLWEQSIDAQTRIDALTTLKRL